MTGAVCLGATELQRAYWRDGLPAGMTVAAYERSLGLPPYSVFPKARAASLSDVGFFMYRNATPEERERSLSKSEAQRRRYARAS